MTEITELVDDPRVRHEVESMARTEAEKPLSVAIMGATGVGKSTLLNALFGTDLAVGGVRPTTMVPEPVKVEGSSGHAITFWDLPGIGESEEADARYLVLYRERLVACDVVLWAVHADSRSTTFDRRALRLLVEGMDAGLASQVLSKVSFVLTKTDAICPPPWIYAARGKDGHFVPTPEARQVLAAKAEYFEEQFLADYGHLLVSRTYNDCTFTSHDRRLTTDTHHVTFAGYLSEDIHRELLASHPSQHKVIERLRDNHRVISCSALYRHNLIRLLSVVVNKIGIRAVGRFRHLMDPASALDVVSVEDMKRYGNLIVFDTRRSRKLFDLSDLSI